MLEALHLKNVGPAPEMRMELAPRLNLVTGDNGLGKSFLLDVAWWALTRTWARKPVLPHAPPEQGEIFYRYTKSTPKSFEHTSVFDRGAETWPVKPARPAIPGLVIYAQVDGGFSVWDPARNYWKKDVPERPASYLFAPDEVWTGNKLCEGLLRDWGSWQRENGKPFTQLRHLLETLSPSPDETLVPGELRKLTVDDPLRYPTLRMPYGEDVPVIHASAGMRRIIALAYLLVWTWQEHVAASEVRGSEPAKEIIFLIDEIEAHLHPKWQRRIVPSLLDVMTALTGDHAARVQLVSVTHSPLVLASAEPRFDETQDAWFDLDLDERDGSRFAHLRKRRFVRHGDATSWLKSEAFDLPETRSVEAEDVLAEASHALADPSFDQQRASELDRRLREVLGDTDSFWTRWRFVGEKQGWLK